jgi:hypothetical protein
MPVTYQPHPGALALVAAAERRAAPPLENSPPPRKWSRIGDLAPLAQPGCTACGGRSGWVGRPVDCGGQRGLEIVACQCTGVA